MQSPLEQNPKILEKIGLFTVLFNLIDFQLGVEYYFIINQSDIQKRPVLDFLKSQDFIKKLNMLKLILGEDIYFEIAEVNKFRNFISHGMYGLGELGVSITKLKRNTGKYESKPLNEDIINKYIERERNILILLHELTNKKSKN